LDPVFGGSNRGAAAGPACPRRLTRARSRPPPGAPPSPSACPSRGTTSGPISPPISPPARCPGAAVAGRAGAARQSGCERPSRSGQRGARETTRKIASISYVLCHGKGAKDLKLDRKVGSLTPGKEADILLLDATALNVAPLNHVPGAVVTLMDRSNVDTVIVAGKVRKWKGRLLSANLAKLRGELEVSRDYLFKAADVRQDLFRN
jgi:Amidohydrolase family